MQVNRVDLHKLATLLSSEAIQFSLCNLQNLGIYRTKYYRKFTRPFSLMEKWSGHMKLAIEIILFFNVALNILGRNILIADC